MSADNLLHDAKPSRLWLLIECCNAEKNYEVIDAVDVIAPREKMHTGKSIKYRKGNLIQEATIVIISDDKDFLDAELQQIIDLEPKTKRDAYKSKRKRQSPPLNYNNQNISQIPSPVWSSNTSDHSVQSNTLITYIPPMTFDQQTQTDMKLFSQKDNGINSEMFQRLNTNLEKVVKECQTLMSENKQIKQQLVNLTNNTNNMQSMLVEVLKKLATPTSVIVEEHEVIGETDTKNEPVVVFTCTSNSGASTPNRILNLSSSNAKSNNFATIETFDFSHDSNLSFSNNSRYSLSNSTNTLYGSTLSIAPSESTKRSKKLIDIVKSDWSEGEPDENAHEHVSIGINNTMVPRFILKNINWSNHSSATRKLLITLFPREVLATHSLTGKPSPAFLDSTKPTKNQLDRAIISDIIECVMRECKVSETTVRSAITTKCADENKMLRQRQEKKRKSIKVLNDATNKENFVVVDESPVDETSK